MLAMADATRISFVPSMARLAIALDKSGEFQGVGRAYRLYLAAQADSVAHNGRGWCTRSALVELFGTMHRRTISRALVSGIGLFWSVEARADGRDRVKLFSQERVAAKLRDAARRLMLWDCDEISPRKAVITAAELTGDYSAFCAACFRGWVSVGKGGRKRITYKVLSEAWARSGPIIAEWIHLAGLERRNNHGEIPCNDHDRSAAYPGFDRENTRNGYYRQDPRGNWFWRFQRGNTYVGDWSIRWKRGRIRHIARSLAGESGDRGSLNKAATITTAHPFALGSDAGHRIRLKTNFEPTIGMTTADQVAVRILTEALGRNHPSIGKLLRARRLRRYRGVKRTYRAWREAHGWHPTHNHYILADVFSRGRDFQQVWTCAPAGQ